MAGKKTFYSENETWNEQTKIKPSRYIGSLNGFVGELRGYLSCMWWGNLVSQTNFKTVSRAYRTKTKKSLSERMCVFF